MSLPTHRRLGPTEVCVARPAKTLWLLLSALLAWTSVNTVCAQLATSGIFLSRSFSGQFLIQSTPGSVASPLAGFLENDTNFVHLDPTLLTVSCERIKQILYRELGAKAPWSGKIFLRLYPTRTGD